MANDRRRRGERPVVRYDNDATVIIETPTEESPKAVIQSRAVSASDVTISVTDVIGTLASYNSAWFAREKAKKNGECLICHSRTAYKFRKICNGCMNKYSGEIYDLAQEAVENGTSITLNVVE